MWRAHSRIETESTSTSRYRIEELSGLRDNRYDCLRAHTPPACLVTDQPVSFIAGRRRWLEEEYERRVPTRAARAASTPSSSLRAVRLLLPEQRLRARHPLRPLRASRCAAPARTYSRTSVLAAGRMLSAVPANAGHAQAALDATRANTANADASEYGQPLPAARSRRLSRASLAAGSVGRIAGSDYECACWPSSAVCSCTWYVGRGWCKRPRSKSFLWCLMLPFVGSCAENPMC